MDRVKISEIIENENIDVVILFGGLFKLSVSEESDKSEKKVKMKQKIRRKNKTNVDKFNEANNILSLNWLGKPVIVVPSPNDLEKTNLIKQIQGQDMIFIRFLNNSSTLIGNWLFVGVINTSTSMKDKEIEIMLESYLGMEDENILFLATGEVADIFNNKKVNLVSFVSPKNTDSNSFIILAKENKSNFVQTIDLTNKIVNSFFID
jgi:Icc-related predicted phosphoesterase